MGRSIKFAHYLLCVVLALPWLVGCGSGSSAKLPAANAPTGSPSGTSNNSSAPSTSSTGSTLRFVYQVLNGFQVDSTSGAISPVPATSTKALNGSPNGLAADPAGRFLYVSYEYFNANGQSYGQQGVQEFALDAKTGAMTEISGSPLTASGPLITNNAGTFLYLGSAAVSGGMLTIYGIDQQTGALTLSAAQGPAFGPEMAMDPQGRFLFTAGGGVSGNEIGVDKLDPTTGAGTAVGSAPQIGPNFILGLAVDPAGKYLFALGQIGAPAQPAVQSFAINADGSLNPTGGPQPAGTNVPTAGSSAAVDASGRFLYVVTDLGLYVRGYAIDSATGAISELPSSPFSVAQLSNPYSVWNAVSADAQAESIYLSNNNGPITYNVDQNTGALTIAPKAPAPSSGNNSYFVAVVP
jgi:6-phosphogluconolactonase (cycloisomerase 2 family)